MTVIFIIISAISSFIFGIMFGSAGKAAERERAEHAINQTLYWKEAYLNLLEKIKNG